MENIQLFIFNRLVIYIYIYILNQISEQTN